MKNIKNKVFPIKSSKNFIDTNNIYFNIRTEYLKLILEMRRVKASNLLMKEVEKGIPIKNIYVYILEPALKEIGNLWQTNKITIAQEHYFTATTQLIMSQLYLKIFASDKNVLKFVGTCVSENLHEIGIKMVSDILELDGWDTYYLGANVQKEDLLSFLTKHKPHVLGISAAMSLDVKKVKEIIKEVKSNKVLNGIKILVGGYIFNIEKNLWKEVGADFYAPDAIETSALLASNFDIEKITSFNNINNVLDIGKEILDFNTRILDLSSLAIKEVVNDNSHKFLIEEQILDEMTKLNNQLITMQRELAKKNIELKILNEKLKQLSITDQLTGLYNRRHFFNAIKAEITKAKRGNYNLSLASIDLNNFKKINDNYGHDEGDKVLRDFAEIAQTHLRCNIDSIYRFGGDEFIIVFIDYDIIYAEKTIKELNYKLKNINELLSLSYGIVEILSYKDITDVEKLLSEADKKMYEYKRNFSVHTLLK